MSDSLGDYDARDTSQRYRPRPLHQHNEQPGNNFIISLARLQGPPHTGQSVVPDCCLSSNQILDLTFLTSASWLGNVALIVRVHNLRLDH